MSLLALKNYLMQIKVSSLANLSSHFNNANPDLLRDMLCHWIRKGKVRCFKKTPFCGQSCSKCEESVVEIYEWVACTPHLAFGRSLPQGEREPSV